MSAAASKATAQGWTNAMLERAAKRYAETLPIVREVARAHGYAISVHGSQVRDLDLIATPWITEASDAETLVEAIRVAVGGHIRPQPAPEDDPHNYLPRRDGTQRNPEPKPHGRLAWSIHLGGGPYIDLSVMPRWTKGCQTGEDGQ